MVPPIRPEDPDGMYEYQKLIGRGAYADVSRVKNKTTGTCLARKKLKKAPDGRERRTIQLINREVAIMNSLDHKNIIKLDEAYTWNGEVYLVMELCYLDLSRLLKVHKLSPAHKKFILYNAIKGLDYLHSNNVLHRDIKPENILMAQDGTVKLADFGSARWAENDMRKRQHTNLVGSIWHRAPELNLGSRKYGKEADVWAIGCVAAELFSGETIMKGSSMGKSQLMAISKMCGNMPNLPGLNNPFYDIPKYSRVIREYMEDATGDPVVAQFVDEILQMNPEQRPDTEQLLHHCIWTTHPLPQPLKSSRAEG